MAKMLIVTRKRIWFYPQGVYDTPAPSSARADWRLRMTLGLALWMWGGLEAALVDMGGEFQIWGRNRADPVGYFHVEVWREDWGKERVNQMMRRKFGKIIADFEHRMAA